MKKHKVIIIVLLSGFVFLGVVGLVKVITGGPDDSDGTNNNERKNLTDTITLFGQNLWDSIKFKEINLAIMAAENAGSIDKGDVVSLNQQLTNSKSFAILKSYDKSFNMDCFNYKTREYLIKEMKGLIKNDDFPKLKEKIDQHTNLKSFIALENEVNRILDGRYSPNINDAMESKIRNNYNKTGVSNCVVCGLRKNIFMQRLDEFKKIESRYKACLKRFKKVGEIEPSDIALFNNYEYYKNAVDSLKQTIRE